MKVGVLSDTHDRLQETDLALEICHRHQAELIIHCGDWSSVKAVVPIGLWIQKHSLSLYGVLGNMDTKTDEMIRASAMYPDLHLSRDPVYRFTLDQHPAAIVHGDNPALVESIGATSFLFTGHTHIPKVVKTGLLTTINPGSVCGPRPPGIPGSRSLAVLDTTTLHVEILYLP